MTTGHRLLSPAAIVIVLAGCVPPTLNESNGQKIIQINQVISTEQPNTENLVQAIRKCLSISSSTFNWHAGERTPDWDSCLSNICNWASGKGFIMVDSYFRIADFMKSLGYYKATKYNVGVPINKPINPQDREKIIEFVQHQVLKHHFASKLPNPAFNSDPAATINHALSCSCLPVSVRRPACGWAG